MYQILHRRQPPQWVWHIDRCQNQLAGTINRLQKEKNEILTDDTLWRSCIEFNTIDITTGDCPNHKIVNYFDRNPLVQIGSKINTESTNTPFFKAAKKVHNAAAAGKPKKQVTVDRLLGEALAHELEDNRHHALVGGEKSRTFKLAHLQKKTKEFVTKVRGDLTRIFCTRKGRQNHRVAMFSAEFTPLSRPSNTEIQVLASLIYDGLQEQRHRMHNSRKRHTIHFEELHHIQPVLMVITYRGAEARVVYGYFDLGLHVQYTDLIKFNEDEFYDQMLDLLQWTLPITDCNTTACPSLSVIAEEDELEKEDDEEESDLESETNWSDPSWDSDDMSIITV